MAFNYSSDDAGAEESLGIIESNGRKGLSYKVSVLDSSGLNDMVKDIETSWEKIDILVNNAGISQPLPIALMEEEDWDEVMDINAKGQFLAARAVLRGMIRRKLGCILNMGSLAGIRLIEAPIRPARLL